MLSNIISINSPILIVFIAVILIIIGLYLLYKKLIHDSSQTELDLSVIEITPNGCKVRKIKRNKDGKVEQNEIS